MTQNTNEILHVIGTDLLDYSFKVQKAISEGWIFSDKSEYAPRAWPHMFEAWMVQEEDIPKGVDTKNENKTLVEDSKGVTKQVSRRGVKK